MHRRTERMNLRRVEKVGRSIFGTSNVGTKCELQHHLKSHAVFKFTGAALSLPDEKAERPTRNRPYP